MAKAGALDPILIGVEKTACIITRCTLYEALYLNRARTVAADILEASTVQLYRKIPKFVARGVAKSKGDLSRRCSMVVALTLPSPRGSLQSCFLDRAD